MAHPYHPELQHDGRENAYASLPGTGSRSFVPHNMTPMKSRATTGPEIPGCHPSRWIQELLHNNFTTCDLFQRANSATFDAPFDWHHEHRLVLNGNQSIATHGRKILSSICLDCHFHFVFKLSWDTANAHDLCSASQATWPMREDVHPWHHLLWAGSEPDPAVMNEWSKYYPLRAREHFVCVAPPCTFQVTLEVSDPRMGTEWVNLLGDEQAILQELNKAREEDPERYESATNDWAKQAPLNLNTYLKNLLESDAQSVRSISKRNKRFAVIFGPRCFQLFKGLGFRETVEVTNGFDEGSFTPDPPDPPTEPEGNTALGTYRAYIEDVRAEVQCLIHRMGQVGEYPSFINSALHADLGCKEMPHASANALTNTVRYTLLGVLPLQTREIIVNAYFRQWDLLPSRRRELVESLMGVANDCGDEELSDFAITQSSVFDSQLPVQGNTDQGGIVNEALAHLGLNPPNTYSAEVITESFRRKLVEQPAEASTARMMLMVIAQSATDDNYQASLVMETDTKMSLDTSKAVLGGGGPDMSRDDWYKAAVDKIQATNNRDEKLLYIQALESLADHTQDYALKAAAAELHDQSELRQPPSGDEMAPEADSDDLSVPVGLNNIGNTCYLNSLLQYLYTVKAVREIATNYEAFRLDLSDDSISLRRLGGNKMTLPRGEAVVAQAFVHELGKLFEKLHTSRKVATRPSQRLANAALLSTHGLLEDSKPATTVTSSEPPPLPLRPSPNLDEDSSTESGQDEGPDMTTVSEHKSGASRAGSLASADTLIGTSDVMPEKGTEAGSVTEDISQGESGDSDVIMGEVAEPQEEEETVDSKVLQALEHQKRSSGTEQQDVEEVMGKIISLLQAAIKPTNTDAETGIQSEKIMETFFVTTVNYTRKFGERTYQSEISYDRAITAYPAPSGACSLYEALGRNFDRQVIENGQLSRYTAIRSLPPVLHVLIQRSMSIGQKNSSPVQIPETLYLDSYMDVPHDSADFHRRSQNWALTGRLEFLKKKKSSFRTFQGSGRLLEKAFNARNQDSKPGQSSGESDSMAVDIDQAADIPLEEDEEDWSFDGPVDGDFYMVSQKKGSAAPKSQDLGGEEAPPLLEGVEEAENAVQRMVDEDIAECEERLREISSHPLKHAYRLEAVICHSGNLSAGHYWVWIHDFESDVWRCYNDARVRAETDTSKVLGDLSRGGEPYFLCYVRDEDKEKWVDVPKRMVPESADESFETGEFGADWSSKFNKTSDPESTEDPGSAIQGPDELPTYNESMEQGETENHP